MDVDEIEFEIEQQAEQPTFLSRLLCCFRKSAADDVHFEESADMDFHADKIIRLTDGYTAYRLLEPKKTQRTDASSPPLIILLHGMQNSSYMWADVAELLVCFEQGPQAQVLVMDFYGHGRSPWDGRNLSLDCLVTQVRELMDGMCYLVEIIVTVLHTILLINAFLSFSAWFIRQNRSAHRLRFRRRSCRWLCRALSSLLQKFDFDKPFGSSIP